MSEITGPQPNPPRPFRGRRSSARLSLPLVGYTLGVDARLEAMVEAARAGGAVALEHYRRGFSVTLKADRSPVTEADREAERAIVDVLRQRYPDHGSLGE